MFTKNQYSSSQGYTSQYSSPCTSPYNRPCTSQYKSQCTSQYKYRYKNRLPSILTLLILTICSFQPVSAYMYVFDDDLSFLEKSDTSHMVLPESDIFFSPQAPLGNWSIHMESCEEASSSLLWRNSFKLPKITPESFDAEINAINSQEEVSGIEKSKVITLKSGEQKAFLRDLSLEEISDNILEKYFYIKTDDVFILSNPSVESIEKLLDNNFMVLSPINTTEIRNPYVSRSSYHLVLLAGYTEDSFVSLDVATKKGQGLQYDKELFLQSIQNNGNKVLFINSGLSNFSQMKKDTLLKSIDAKATAFKVELASRLESVPPTKRKEVLHRVNTALLNKISNTTDDTKKMELKRFHLIVSGELRGKG